MKAFLTDQSLAYLKTIRELCGAHGFLHNSNLPFLIDVTSPNVTVEGDTYF